LTAALTLDELREGLASGHPDMPTFRFSREDARALTAYLRFRVATMTKPILDKAEVAIEYPDKLGASR
jgi:hypothetical protein